MTGKKVQYAIYRSDETMPYFLRAYSDQNFYVDDSACQSPPFYHAYKVNALYIDYSDTCESDFSNVAEENCVGITENNNESDISIYPNPARDLIRVESSESLRSIEIYNGFGQLILEIETDNGSIEIQVKDFQPGLYIIRFKTDNQMIFKKILILN